MQNVPQQHRGCTHCEAVGEACPDCDEHLDAELVLVVPGSPRIIFTGFQHYLAASKRGAPPFRRIGPHTT